MCNNWQLLTAQIIAGPLPLGAAFLFLKEGLQLFAALLLAHHQIIILPHQLIIACIKMKHKVYHYRTELIFFHFVTH
jgi:hypothetical protein